MQRYRQFCCQRRLLADTGLTLLETLVVVTLVGILSAIAVPSWLAFINIQNLNAAQGRVYRAMRYAQSNAKRDKTTWQVSFQEIDAIPHLAVHRRNAKPAAASWENMGSQIRIDTPETTLSKSKGIWRIQFNDRGHANGQIGRITLKSIYSGKAKRCVIVSTLIGTIRKARENPKPKDKKFCY